MSRAKSNDQIVREVIMRRAVDGPLRPEWQEVVWNRLDNILAALEFGNASREDQREAAEILKRLTVRRRGRPAAPVAVDIYSGFAWFVDHQASLRPDVEKKEAHRLALHAAIAAHRDDTGVVIDIETAETYYLRGVSLSAPGDARFAAEIDAADVDKAGASQPLRPGAAAILSPKGSWSIMDRQRYARGKRRLKTSRPK